VWRQALCGLTQLDINQFRKSLPDTLTEGSGAGVSTGRSRALLAMLSARWREHGHDTVKSRSILVVGFTNSALRHTKASGSLQLLVLRLLL
jgi:hypothetical protein